MAYYTEVDVTNIINVTSFVFNEISQNVIIQDLDVTSSLIDLDITQQCFDPTVPPTSTISCCEDDDDYLDGQGLPSIAIALIAVGGIVGSGIVLCCCVAIVCGISKSLRNKNHDYNSKNAVALTGVKTEKSSEQFAKINSTEKEHSSSNKLKSKFNSTDAVT